MLKTQYIGPLIKEKVDEIKFAALYFDSIEIIEHVFGEVEPLGAYTSVPKKDLIGKRISAKVTKIFTYTDDEFSRHTELLFQEGILSSRIDNLRELSDDLLNQIFSQTYSIVDQTKDCFIKRTEPRKSENVRDKLVEIKFADPEIRQIYETFKNPIDEKTVFDLRFVKEYYHDLLSSILAATAYGNQVLTTSNVLNNLMKSTYDNEEVLINRKKIAESIHQSPSLAFEAIKLNLPDVSQFSMEDVLEIRYQLRDELENFRFEMERINFELLQDFDTKYIETHAKELVKYKINPLIDDLKKKADNEKIQVLKRLFNDLRDPKAYTPLIGTVTGQIPVHIAAMLSVGLIGISAAWDYVQNNKDIRDNGLYYLIKLNKLR
ncbi:hypothetical protein ACPOM7_17115 [Peribacillus castrilensis]|uniref:hypothetical protein n=1 Tax=Bacillaceae TaxID=186817 RepID=UPI000660BFD3|nr:MULTISPECIES: hypothetical protein [Bacillaceae]PRA79621.1 hypothetical protein CQ056_22555 [Peribacillus simplex]